MPIPAILFVLCFFALCIAAIAHDASWAIVMYVGLYFLDPLHQWWAYGVPNLPWMMMISGAAILGFFMRYRTYAHAKVFEAPAMRAIIWFSLAIVLITPLAAWPERQWIIIDKQLKVLAILLIMYKVMNERKKLELLLWTYLAGLYYIGSIARARGRSGGGRLDGIGTIDSTDVNDLGSIFVAGIPLLVFYIMEGKNLYVRFLALICLAYALNTLVLLNSRGAFLGLVAAVGVYLFVSCFMMKRSTAYRVKIVAGVLAALGLLLYLADDSFWQRQSTISTGERVDASTAALTHDSDGGRLELWGYALSTALRHPLGLGGYGFNALSPKILPPVLLDGLSQRSVHSTYFEALTAFGFIGLLLFMRIIWTTFRELLRIERRLRGQGLSYPSLQACALGAGFAGYLVCGIFVTRLYSEATYYLPVFCAIFVAVHRRELSAETAASVPAPPSTSIPARQSR